jgi:hypothetical protein
MFTVVYCMLGDGRGVEVEGGHPVILLKTFHINTRCRLRSTW